VKELSAFKRINLSKCCDIGSRMTHFGLPRVNKYLKLRKKVFRNVFLIQYHHMSLMDFVVSPPSCGRSVTDFWGWNAHEAQLRCPDEEDGDIWIWSTGRALNINSTNYPDHGHHGNPPLSGKNPHGRAWNRTRDLMFSQKHCPLDQCFPTAVPRPGTGPWHQLYRAARGKYFIVEIFWGE
jgi:hypothetical protein